MKKTFNAIILIFLSLTLFAQKNIEIGNKSISRRFSVEDSVFTTVSLKNLNTGKEFIRRNCREFSFRADSITLQSDMFSFVSSSETKELHGQKLIVELKGKDNTEAKGILVYLSYWVYEDLPVVRKQISIRNNRPVEVAITDPDIENLMLDVSGVHYSEIHTAYGQNTETVPYRGNYNDAALLVFDPLISQGVIFGNEAISVMKRTEIYTRGFPSVQMGLSSLSDQFPFQVHLKNGEQFHSPKTFICLVEAPVWQLAYEEVFADFVREHLGIRLYGHESPPLLMYNTWRPFRTDIDEKIIKETANALEGSGTDLFIIDCGWYDMMGNYDADKQKFPEGMEPVCKYIKNKGMKTGLWFSFATANENSWAVKEHPEWILRDKNGSPVLVHDVSGSTLGEKCYTMSMASPWYNYIYNVLSKYIRTCNLSYVKLDLAAVIGSYQPDPEISGDFEGGGVKEYKGRESSYWAIFQKTLQFCDDLHKEFPELLIDYTYETHGRHNGVDFALLQHAEYDWITNYELEPPAGPISIRQIRSQRARTMPVSALLIGNQNMVNSGKGMNEYTYLSVVSATGILVGDVRQMDDSTKNWYNKWNSWFKEMNQKFQFARYYQTGDVFDSPARGNWDGCYRFNTVKEGGILFFYRNDSPDELRRFKVHCLNPESFYRIYDPVLEKEIGIFSGKTLVTDGISVTLPGRFSAKVLGIEKTKN